jgi:3',5'-cyclic AMP phosphodiesterase CpdA
MKKQLLLTFVIICLMLLIPFGCVRAFQYSIGCAEVEADQDFTFFITSDLHYFSKKLYDNGKAFNDFLMSGDGKLLQYTDEFLNALMKDIETEQPDFIVIAGDLTCNGERESHLELVEKLETIEDMGTCVFVVPGNHDINNPFAKSYMGDEEINISTITGDEYMSLYAPFGYDEAVSKDPDSLSYLAMPTEDTWFLMLDSTDYENNQRKQYPEQGGVLPSRTLNWIEQCCDLAKENGARLIAVMHHSLTDHSTIINEDYTINNSEEALKVFHKCGIEVCLTGHIHIQDIKTNQSEGKTLYDIGTSSLSVYPHQYGRMNFTPYIGFDYRTVKLDMVGWAIEEKIADESLLDFEACSAEFFIKQCGKMHQRCLAELDGLSEKDRSIVLDTIDRMNMMYFAGYRNEALSEIVESEGFKILESVSPCFTKNYAMSMLNDERTDNNIIFINISGSE